MSTIKSKSWIEILFWLSIGFAEENPDGIFDKNRVDKNTQKSSEKCWH